MAKKFYAVKNGKDGESGVYLTWEECRARVEGVSEACYKGFATREQAEAFLRGDELPPREKPQKREPPEPPFREGWAIAYVDGSYHSGTKEFAAGAVLFYEHQRVDFFEKNADPEMAEMHNVAGEIMAAVLVIRYCAEHGISAVEIWHDYAGVGKWGTGEWKTNRPGTQAYAAFCRKASQLVRLEFRSVRGHSGDYWNDEADRLAKKALGIV